MINEYMDSPQLSSFLSLPQPSELPPSRHIHLPQAPYLRELAFGTSGAMLPWQFPLVVTMATESNHIRQEKGRSPSHCWQKRSRPSGQWWRGWGTKVVVLGWTHTGLVEKVRFQVGWVYFRQAIRTHDRIPTKGRTLSFSWIHTLDNTTYLMSCCDVLFYFIFFFGGGGGV